MFVWIFLVPKSRSQNFISLLALFEELVINGILVKYPEFYMKNYLGDRAYASRMPTNPAPGDIRQVIKEYCILPLGSQMIRNFAPCIKSILIAGRRSHRLPY